MVGIGGANESIWGDQKERFALLEEGDVLVDERLRAEPLLQRSCGDIDRVLIGPRQEAHFLAPHASPTRDHIRPDHLIERVQSRLVVGVGDGRCQVVPHRVGVSHTIRPPYAARGTLA